MSNELLLTIITALFTSVIGPIAVHYAKELVEKRKKKEDPLAKSMAINSLITDKLDEIKGVVSCDRIWLLQFHNGGNFYPTGKSIQKFSMVYELTKSGMPSCQTQFQNIPVSLFNKTINKLHQGEIIKLEDTEDNKDVGIANMVADAGIKSCYMFPIYTIKGEFIGIVGIDYLAKKEKLTSGQLVAIEVEIATIGGVLANYLKS